MWGISHKAVSVLSELKSLLELYYCETSLNPVWSVHSKGSLQTSHLITVFCLCVCLLFTVFNQFVSLSDLSRQNAYSIDMGKKKKQICLGPLQLKKKKTLYILNLYQKSMKASHTSFLLLPSSSHGTVIQILNGYFVSHTKSTK